MSNIENMKYKNYLSFNEVKLFIIFSKSTLINRNKV